MIKSKLFSRFENLVYGMSEIKNGGMLYECFKDKLAKKNRERFLKKFNLSLIDLILSNQVHSNIVRIVKRKHLGLAGENKSLFKKADGLVTKEKGIFLAIFTADCLPIFMHDYKEEIVGLIHSGWKGSLKKIVFKAVRVFKKLGSNPKDILVYIGPSIGPCHYDIPEERAKIFVKKFKNWKKFIIAKKDKYYLDLWSLNKLLLLEMGLKNKNIEVSKLCTFESKRFFSLRRNRNQNFKGEMISIIGMKK